MDGILREQNAVALSSLEQFSSSRQRIESIVSAGISYMPRGRGALSVLELGAGTGELARALCDAGCRVTMVEFSRPMAACARHTAPDATLIIDDFMQHTFKEEFDAIFAVAFLHLFPKKDVLLVLKKIRSLLRLGGVVVFSSAHRPVSKEQKKDAPIQVLNRFSYEELVSLLTDAGFSILEYFESRDDEHTSQALMTFIVSLQG